MNALEPSATDPIGGVTALDWAPRRGRDFVRAFTRRPLAMIGFVILFMLLVVALFTSRLAPHGLTELLDAKNLAGPARDHLFGTDNLGRDTFTRIMFGTRVSLTVSVVAVALAALVGGMLGLLSGFASGVWDLLIQRLMDAMMAIPTLILALVIGITFGATVKSLVLAIGIAFVPQVQRVVRAAVIAVRDRPFVEAAAISGCRPSRILFVHIAPQVVAPTLVIATALMGQAIIIESAISFVGAGPAAPTVTWGGMLSAGLDYHPSRAVWLLFFPGAAIFVTVFAFNVIGDALRDIFDPRLKS